jgi:alkylation response protein AidB-like acyl-CoA dehydrogenase
MTTQQLNDNLCDERQAFAELAHDLALKKLVENIEEHDRYPFTELYTDAIADAGTVGFYGINLNSRYGGVDMNTHMVAVILEQLSQHEAGLAGVVFTNAAALEIIRQASEETDCAQVYAAITSLGTAPLAFQSYASPAEMEIPEVDANGKLWGIARYLVLGNFADYAVIPAQKPDTHDYSLYLVNLSSHGVVKSDPILSLGFHTCPAVDITLNGADALLIGSHGKGNTYFDAMQKNMGLCAAAVSLGIMKGSLQSALQYTADRYQGGRQIIDWPQVRMLLANMAIEVKIGESVLARAGQELENGCTGWGDTSLAAAIHVGEMATRSATDGVQLFGGNGYTKDYPQEKRMRDARQAQCLLGMVPLKKIKYIAGIIDENI